MTGVSTRSAVVGLGLSLGLLAGCLPTATPAVTSSPPAPISSPAPSSVASSFPAPSKPAPQAAIQAFVDQVSDPGFSYTATLSGRSRHSTDILPIKGTLAVSGANYALVANFTFPDHKTYKVEQRYVRGVGWLRFYPESWQKLKAFGEDDVLSPFAGILAPSDVTLLEVLPAKRSRIRMSALILTPALIPAFNVTTERVDRTKLDLVIDQSGRPLTGTWQLNGTARVSGQLQEVVMELTAKFAKIGANVTVRAP
jgi:hypothetical protein